MFYYVEIKDGKIASYGDTSDMELALKNTTGRVLEITEKEYALLSACKGDTHKGIFALQQLNRKIYESEQEQ